MAMTPGQLLTVLATTPTRLAAVTAGLDQNLLITSRDEEWSVNEVLAHLRSCADVWGDAIGQILAEDGPTIRAVNPTTWIESTDYREQEFVRSLRQFAAQRGDLLTLLDPLPAVAWQRSATVTGAGAPLRKSVLDYADRLARHERTHLKQVEALVAQLQL
jgi:hypothetical protein